MVGRDKRGEAMLCVNDKLKSVRHYYKECRQMYLLELYLADARNQTGIADSS